MTICTWHSVLQIKDLFCCLPVLYTYRKIRFVFISGRLNQNMRRLNGYFQMISNSIERLVFPSVQSSSHRTPSLAFTLSKRYHLLTEQQKQQSVLYISANWQEWCNGMTCRYTTVLVWYERDMMYHNTTIMGNIISKTLWRYCTKETNS